MRLFSGDGASSGEKDNSASHGEITSRQRMTLLAIAAGVLVVIALFTLVATSGGTPLTRCTRIIIQSQRSSCLFELANTTGNATVCLHISGSGEGGCIANVALQQNNVSLCSLSGNATFAACVSALGEKERNPSYCSSLQDPYESICTYAALQAGNFSNVGECSLILNGSVRDNCTYRSYYNLAVSSRSGAYCSYLPTTFNSSLINFILSSSTQLFGIANASLTISSLNTSPQSYCYYNLAHLTSNISLCSMTTGQLKMICSGQLSTPSTQQNVTFNISVGQVGTLCANVPVGVQNECDYGIYSYIAVANRNASVCGLIPTGALQYSCYAAIAGRYKNVTYCSYIGNATDRILCNSQALGVNSTT
ncbi:MAG TPA: hypothetical protein VL944_03050 [Candidatus Acidoferrum sp.]|nr:hypothetical protein [Candidatus Acidoferrum sp.]